MFKKPLAILTAGLLAAGAVLTPASAQGYRDRGYDDDEYGAAYDDYPSGDYEYDRDQDYDRDQYERDREQYYRDRDDYDRDVQRWRDRYERSYTYTDTDDFYYRDCVRRRQGNQVGGALVGGVIGGILGSAIGRGPARGGATVAGALLGGVAGASIANDLDCEDQHYVYQTYYDGFERGRPHAHYSWRNPHSGRYGYFRVGEYYRDRGGYRCATYSQTIYIDGRPREGQGRACRQRDGTWAIVN